MAEPPAARLVLALSALSLAGAVWTGPATAADDPAVRTVIGALEAVCRPSTEADVNPEVSATRLGYPSVDVPPNLPTGRPLHAWQVPSPGPGKVYVLQGGLPDSAQAGCVLAVYGAASPTLPGAIQARLARDRAGFQPNPTLSISGPRQSVARFERRRGDVVTAILVIQPKAVTPDQPSSLVVVSRVNYGWLDKFAR